MVVQSSLTEANIHQEANILIYPKISSKDKISAKY